MSQPAIAPTIEAMRLRLAPIRQTGVTIGLVPTMGALHRGHARLIEKARHECSHVVVSIFVNPIQFDRRDDLARYPRPFEADVALCAQHGVHDIFAPSAAEMYPSPAGCRIDVGSVADHLCGAFRPGHFSGVATVVMKLLQITQPHRAYFGEKDAQQLAVIRRMVADFNVPTNIIGVETIRDGDGLAVSSRNQHLSVDERRKAVALPAALERARQLVESGAQDPNAVIESATATVPADPAIRLEYLQVVDPHVLQPVATITRPVLIAAAMWVGNTRLIDNITT